MYAREIQGKVHTFGVSGKLIKNALVNCKGGTILPDDLALGEEVQSSGGRAESVAGKAPFEAMVHDIFEDLLRQRWASPNLNTFDVLEKELILHALRRTSGNQVQASKLLGITRATLRKRIARYGISIGADVRMRDG